MNDNRKKNSNKNTKELISNELEKLLTLKPISKISVTELVDSCDLTRQTFYRYFEDIYDVLLWTFNSNTTGYKMFDETKDFERSMYHSLSNMIEHPRLCRHIFLNDKDQIFYNRFVRNRIDYAKKDLGAKKLTPEVCFALELFWEGFSRILIHWIESGMNESPEVMARYAYNCLPDILKPYYI